MKYHHAAPLGLLYLWVFDYKHAAPNGAGAARGLAERPSAPPKRPQVVCPPG